MGSSASYQASLSILKLDGKSKKIISIQNDIYYDNDNDDENTESGLNKTSEKFIITQEFIDSLKPGDKLVLKGNGNCY